MSAHTATQHSAIPTFFLYGEPPRHVAEHFLHVEPLEYRSRPSHWRIRPHAHADLNHVLFITSGDGDMTVDGAIMRFRAPCLLVVPAQRVHSFAFAANTGGWVLTVAESYVRDLIRREKDFVGIFAAARCIAAAETDRLEFYMHALAQELVWTVPGSAAAIEASLLGVLVTVLRLSHRAAIATMPVAGRALDIVARFRELIEARFRSAAALPSYATALHVSEGQLRRACLHIAGRPPVSLIHDRMFLEAQRLLVYTNMTIAETAAYLGFSDAAYFTRFFSKHAGQSPREYRKAKAART